VAVLKKIFWPIFWVAVVCGVVLFPLIRVLPRADYFVLLLIIPFFLWMLTLLLQNDRLCSATTRYVVLLVSAACLALGIVLRQYGVFSQKAGFFVVAFGMPLLFVGFSEICRLVYVAIRHETPCINVRSGRWIGDPPVNGFFTTYPPGKIISGADILFGLTQWVVPLVVAMVLIIWSLAADW